MLGYLKIQRPHIKNSPTVATFSIVAITLLVSAYSNDGKPYMEAGTPPVATAKPTPTPTPSQALTGRIGDKLVGELVDVTVEDFDANVKTVASK